MDRIVSLLELSSFEKNNDLKATILAKVEHANPAGNESVGRSLLICEYMPSEPLNLVLVSSSSSSFEKCAELSSSVLVLSWI